MSNSETAPEASGDIANSVQPARKRSDRKLPWISTKEECEAVKAMPNTRCPTGLRNRTMLELMHRGGLRVSEIRHLRRRDIVWTQSLVEVRAGKGGVDRGVKIEAGTRECLRAWDAVRHRGEFFFNTLKGGELSSQYIQQMVRRMVKRAIRRGKLDADRATKITPHKFRHAHATELMERGTPIAEIQKRLGHMRMSTTEIYLHARPHGIEPFLEEWIPNLPPQTHPAPKSE